MPSKVAAELRRSGPFVTALRNFLIGRNDKNPLRFAPSVSSKIQPPPEIPEGPAHRLSNNYYYTHDGRREMIPPVVVVDASFNKALTSGSELSKAIGTRKAPRPGNVYQWD